MSLRRRIALGVVGVVTLLLLAATFWEPPGSNRNARVLLLDPKTGKTLNEREVEGGYAIAVLLRGGRVAVGSLDSCPDQKGGRMTVLDASLRVIGTKAVNPCTVARLDKVSLRARFGLGPDPSPVSTPDDVTLRLGRGKLVQKYAKVGDLYWLDDITAYDAAGRVLWQRASMGPIGVVDVRDGRVVVTHFGKFTPGSD